jgi:hypothetical protein
MRLWRSHPVLFAFAIASTLGFLNAAVLMSTVGIFKVLMSPTLLTLWPTSILALEDLGGPPSIVRFNLFIGLVSNAALYGVVFASTVGLVIAIRRSFGASDKPTSIGRM